ncbi:hypothetical protein HDK90DRAFT_448549 [Phyllosticta capitalensis]|uniref:Alcohol dehydrogenase-like N-terminal domain-containing protein n=2 Tax=Phyllosticta capitalensis TaxID=121624 RepID=A0ABR1Z069_9PEZI
MISQPEIQQPTRGAFEDLRRGLSIADLKANVISQTTELPLSISNGTKTPHAPSSNTAADDVPELQTVLLLYQPKTRYALTPKHPVPEIRSEKNELLIKIEYIGLNPIDWKSSDFGWGIPTLPYISGRDFLGTVVRSSAPSRPIGSTVLAVSTDYRDVRKSAYQHYAVSAAHTVCSLPLSGQSGLVDPSHASLGVAFTAAVLALGVCLGVDFSSSGASGFDFLHLLRSGTPASSIPTDVRAECLHGISEAERARPGDWIAIWGGGTTTALMLTQLAKAAGLWVALVGDAKKHGGRVSQRGGGLAAPDLMIDCWDEERAVDVLRGVAGGRLRLAVDTVSKETAGKLAEALTSEGGERVHLVGLSGAPKNVREGVFVHTVPIKVFHEVEAVGLQTMDWLASLLREGKLVTPEVEVVEGGLRSVNGALDRMRKNEVPGKRLVVRL